jgi:hypothetical protein
MSQNTTTLNNLNDRIYKIVSYVPLVIIFVGLLGNTTSFLIFSFNKEMNKYSSMVFLSFIAVTDTLGLFIWNLNHFLYPNYSIKLEKVSLFNCKFFTFLQYVTLQSSGLLYSIISIDRYFAVMSKPGSFMSRLPFGTPKSALKWSIVILIGTCLFNIHLLIINGYYKYTYTNSTNGTQLLNKTSLVCYASPTISLSPLWDMVQAVVYTFIPFIIMAIFNSLLILNLRVKEIKKTSNMKKKRITISLAVITFAFIIMTAPGTIVYGFFADNLNASVLGKALLTVFDSIM